MSKILGNVAVINAPSYVNNQAAEAIAEEGNQLLGEGIVHLILNLAESKMVNSVGIAIIIEVIDNFLPEDNFKMLQKAIMTPVTFPWYYVPILSDARNSKEYYFIHFFYESIEHPPSQSFPLIKKLLFFE